MAIEQLQQLLLIGALAGAVGIHRTEQARELIAQHQHTQTAFVELVQQCHQGFSGVVLDLDVDRNGLRGALVLAFGRLALLPPVLHHPAVLSRHLPD